jgi:hypothetical protein
VLSAKEISFYNQMCDSGLAQKIECPFNEDDIIITKIDEKDNPYFYCISCNTKFDIGKNTEEKIKKSIDKFLSR